MSLPIFNNIKPDKRHLTHEYFTDEVIKWMEEQGFEYRDVYPYCFDSEEDDSLFYGKRQYSLYLGTDIFIYTLFIIDGYIGLDVEYNMGGNAGSYYINLDKFSSFEQAINSISEIKMF